MPLLVEKLNDFKRERPMRVDTFGNFNLIMVRHRHPLLEVLDLHKLVTTTIYIHVKVVVTGGRNSVSLDFAAALETRGFLAFTGAGLEGAS